MYTAIENHHEIFVLKLKICVDIITEYKYMYMYKTIFAKLNVQ